MSKDLSNEQAGPWNYLGKESPGRRNSKCKGLEAGMEFASETAARGPVQGVESEGVEGGRCGHV